MKRLPLDDLQTGMRLARPVIAGDGTVLLEYGAEMTEYRIKRLKAHGVQVVYISDPDAVGEPDTPPEVVDVETRIKTVQLLSEAFKRVEEEKRLDVQALADVLNDILEQILSRHDAIIFLGDLSTHDDTTYLHSVNVCVLSLVVGKQLGMTRPHLYQMGLGALLHDVGRVKIPQEILTKKGRLTDEERLIVESHARAGFDILRAQRQISIVSAHVAYQHHERLDGSGYPRGLQGSSIHRFARVVAVADVFDALMAARAYRDGLSFRQGVGELMAMRGKLLDPDAVDALVERLALYPEGALVLLTTGELAVVAEAGGRPKEAPVVLVVGDSKGRRLAKAVPVDLKRDLTRQVDRLLSVPAQRDA